MLDDMVQIKIAVEGMKAEIIKLFDAEQISSAIEQATRKAVDDFDMENFIKATVKSVFIQAREKVIVELAEKYGGDWAADLETAVDKKIKEALKDN